MKRLAPTYRLCAAAILFLFLFAVPAHAWIGIVQGVHDGDSIAVLDEATGEIVKVRLYGVDAPEFPWPGRWGAQPYCVKSRDFLRELLPVGATVTVHDMRLDKYGRTVGSIINLPDGRIAQEELLIRGLVWIYPRYCNGCQQWKKLEREAREKRKGLWRSNNPVPPWEWRKGEEEN